MAACLPKLAVALLLARVFTPQRAMNIVFITLASIQILFGVVVIIITFVQCNPIPGQWDPARFHPKCWSPEVQINSSIGLGG